MISTFRLLSLCTSASSNGLLSERLRAATRDFIAWDTLVQEAEDHGLAPLLLARLLGAGISVPPYTKAQLQARWIQHAHAYAVRTRVLSDVLRAMDDAGIERLILKGAALAHLVYRQPLLRPMRDVDVLVRHDDAIRTQRLLEESGFCPEGTPVAPEYHHLRAMSKTVDGATVTIEVHREILRATPFIVPLTYDDLSATAQSFEWAGITLRTLGREEMLWHIYMHGFAINVLCPGIRLISVADLVHLTEAWCDHLDWNRVQRHYGRVFRALPLLHHLSPWSPRVLARLRADVSRTPSGIRPMSSSFAWSDVLNRDVLWPPEWWFRVRYGIRGRARWLWYRVAGHPIRLLAAGVGTARRRFARRRRSKFTIARERTDSGAALQNWIGAADARADAHREITR